MRSAGSQPRFHACRPKTTPSNPSGNCGSTPSEAKPILLGATGINGKPLPPRPAQRGRAAGRCEIRGASMQPRSPSRRRCGLIKPPYAMRPRNMSRTNVGLLGHRLARPLDPLPGSSIGPRFKVPPGRTGPRLRSAAYAPRGRRPGARDNLPPGSPWQREGDQLVADLRRKDRIAADGESHVFAALEGVDCRHRYGRRVDEPLP